MPELPEITILGQQMNSELVSKTIDGIEIVQPKCLNLPPEDFTRALIGAEIRKVFPKGKWLHVETDLGWLLLNLGMGGEVLLVTRETLPAKYRLLIDFSDRTC